MQAVRFCAIVAAGLEPELASADFMKRHSIAALAGLVTASMTVAATAHHSIAVFDQAHPIELVGTVREFLFTRRRKLRVGSVCRAKPSVSYSECRPHSPDIE
jgi:hypothetical protein